MGIVMSRVFSFWRSLIGTVWGRDRALIYSPKVGGAMLLAFVVSSTEVDGECVIDGECVNKGRYDVICLLDISRTMSPHFREATRFIEAVAANMRNGRMVVRLFDKKVYEVAPGGAIEADIGGPNDVNHQMLMHQISSSKYSHPEAGSGGGAINPNTMSLLEIAREKKPSLFNTFRDENLEVAARWALNWIAARAPESSKGRVSDGQIVYLLTDSQNKTVGAGMNQLLDEMKSLSGRRNFEFYEVSFANNHFSRPRIGSRHDAILKSGFHVEFDASLSRTIRVEHPFMPAGLRGDVPLQCVNLNDKVEVPLSPVPDFAACLGLGGAAKGRIRLFLEGSDPTKSVPKLSHDLIEARDFGRPINLSMTVTAGSIARDTNRPYQLGWKIRYRYELDPLESGFSVDYLSEVRESEVRLHVQPASAPELEVVRLDKDGRAIPGSGGTITGDFVTGSDTATLQLRHRRTTNLMAARVSARLVSFSQPEALTFENGRTEMMFDIGAKRDGPKFSIRASSRASICGKVRARLEFSAFKVGLCDVPVNPGRFDFDVVIQPNGEVRLMDIKGVENYGGLRTGISLVALVQSRKNAALKDEDAAQNLKDEDAWRFFFDNEYYDSRPLFRISLPKCMANQQGEILVSLDGFPKSAVDNRLLFLEAKEVKEDGEIVANGPEIQLRNGGDYVVSLKVRKTGKEELVQGMYPGKLRIMPMSGSTLNGVTSGQTIPLSVRLWGGY